MLGRGEVCARLRCNKTQLRQFQGTCFNANTPCHKDQRFAVRMSRLTRVRQGADNVEWRSLFRSLPHSRPKHRNVNTKIDRSPRRSTLAEAGKDTVPRLLLQLLMIQLNLMKDSRPFLYQSNPRGAIWRLGANFPHLSIDSSNWPMIHLFSLMGLVDANSSSSTCCKDMSI